MNFHNSQLKYFNSDKDKPDKSYKFTQRELILIAIDHSPGLQTFEIANLLKVGTGNMGGNLQSLKSQGKIEMKEGGWYIIA